MRRCCSSIGSMAIYPVYTRCIPGGMFVLWAYRTYLPVQRAKRIFECSIVWIFRRVHECGVIGISAAHC